MAQIKSEGEAIGGDITTPEGNASCNNNDTSSDSSVKQNSSEKAIKFMADKLTSDFNDEESQILFKYYCLGKDTNELNPTDVRYLLFDLLRAVNESNIIKNNIKYPLFVPDECLNIVFKELCLQDKQTISWIEFKSFFVFLQDKPLFKLFQLITGLYELNEFNNAKLISIVKKPFNDQNDTYKNSDELQNKEYSIEIWQGIIKNNVLPTCKNVYVYKNASFDITGLCLGIIDDDNDINNNEDKKAEIEIDNVKYECILSVFDYKTDIFPRIFRSGGIKSKVARKLANSIVYAKEWDDAHFKISQKTNKLFKQVSNGIINFDNEYKITENIKNQVNKVKQSESLKKVSNTISDYSQKIDQKLKISQKVEYVSNKINENESVQKIKSNVKTFAEQTKKNFNDITNETKQNIIQKETELNANKQTHNQYNNDINNDIIPNNNEINNNNSNDNEIMHVTETNGHNINDNNNDINNNNNNNPDLMENID